MHRANPVTPAKAGAQRLRFYALKALGPAFAGITAEGMEFRGAGSSPPSHTRTAGLSPPYRLRAGDGNEKPALWRVFLCAIAAAYMFRRYSPPTSYNAWLICPRLCVFTASTSAANTLRRSRAVRCR